MSRVAARRALHVCTVADGCSAHVSVAPLDGAVRSKQLHRPVQRTRVASLPTFRTSHQRRHIHTHKVPDGMPDPTGIWQYEVNNEKLLGKTSDIRKVLHVEVAEGLRTSLSYYLPEKPLLEPAKASESGAAEATFQSSGTQATEILQRHYESIVERTIALALAGDGNELRRIIELSHYLAPYPVAYGTACVDSAGDLGKAEETVAAAVEAETQMAPPGVMGMLTAIVEMPAGPGFDALMQLLEQRSQGAAYARWMSLVGRRAALDTGEVIDFSAAPLPKRDHDMDAAHRHLLQDLCSSLHAESRLLPYMEPEERARALISAAMIRKIDPSAPTSHQEMLTIRDQQANWCRHHEPQFAHALSSLPESDLALLCSLRTGLRTWRLDLADWHALAMALLKPVPASGARTPPPPARTPLHMARFGQSGMPAGLETAPVLSVADPESASMGVKRVALGVLLRGKLCAERPATRSNPIVLRAIADAVQSLPEKDVMLLLEKWRTLEDDAAQRCVARVLRFGKLNPGKDAHKVTDKNRETAERFVCAMLSQTLLDVMPASWEAWHRQLVQGVKQLPAERLRVLADVLALPKEISQPTLTHVILQLVAPERIQAEKVFGYMETVQEIWEGVGIGVGEVDEHLIKHLVPRVIDRLANVHGAPVGPEMQYLSEETLIEVAAVLGQMETAPLMALKQSMHKMTSHEVHDIISNAFDTLLAKMGIEREQFTEWLRQSALTGEGEAEAQAQAEAGQGEDELAESALQEEMLKQRLSHVESFGPTAWLPVEMMPMRMAHAREWRQAFHNTAFALGALLHDDLLACREDDWAKARMLYLLAEELGIVSPETSNVPAVLKYLLNTVPVDGADALLGPATIPTSYGDPDVPPSISSNPSSYGLYPATLELVNVAVLAHPSTAHSALALDEAEYFKPGEELTTLEGLSANGVARLLVLAEAQKIVKQGGLLRPVMTALLWGWENVPRNYGLTLVRYYGDVFSSHVAPLEVAYACARLAREDEGIRKSCAILDFEQKLELAHVVAARRLQEAGLLGDRYVPAAERVQLVMRAVAQGLSSAGGDAESAAEESRKVSLYLDELPNAEAAIDFHMNRSNAVDMQMATGSDIVEMQLRREMQVNSDDSFSRLDRTGAVSSKLAMAGDGLLMPDLIQNIADRPLDEVMDFFERLQNMPTKPDIETLRSVFSWYDDGFLGGVNYEEDPVAAWRLFEQMYLEDADTVAVRQRNKGDPGSGDMVKTLALLEPPLTDPREELAGVSLEEQVAGPGNLPALEEDPLAQESPPSAATAPLSPRQAAIQELEATAATEKAAAAAGVAMQPTHALVTDVDVKGRALARGRRKDSSARVWLSHGVGDVTVNGKPLGAYFPGAAQRAAVVAPLTALGTPGAWTVNATVEGGGRTGQAEAIQLGVARAMVKLEPEAHRALKDYGLLTRDPRVVECKKPTRKKARKRRQWVKR